MNKLVKYQNVITGDAYYGYRLNEATVKEIDGVKFIEVTTDISKVAPMWVKLESVKCVGEVDLLCS